MVQVENQTDWKMVVEEKLEDVKESLHRRQVAVFKRIRPIAHIFENSEESANCECDDEIYQREAEPKRFAFEIFTEMLPDHLEYLVESDANDDGDD